MHPDAEHAMGLICTGGRDLPAAILDEIIQTFLGKEAVDEEGEDTEYAEVEEEDVG